MPHLALTRPLRKFYLAYELRNEPRYRIHVLHFLIERLFVGAEGKFRWPCGLFATATDRGKEQAKQSDSSSVRGSPRVQLTPSFESWDQ